MDISQNNSIIGVGSAASTRVASSLSPQSTASAKTASASNVTGKATSSSTSSTSSSDITSSDFLTLLVSELQNQDTTQPTDPNQYITQLTEVNSLQQLISINSGISTLDSSVSPNSSNSSTNAVRNSANADSSSLGVSQVGAHQNSIWGGVTSDV